MTTAIAKTYKLSVPPEVVATTVAELPEHLGEPLQWLYDTAVEKHWTLKDIGLHIGRDKSNIPRVWRNTYQGSLNAFVVAVNAFRERYLELEGTVDEEFQMIAEAKDVFYACEKIIAAREIGMIYGKLGCGKTKALEEFDRRMGSKSHYMRVPSSCSFGQFLRKFARSLGIAPCCIDLMREKIISRIRRRNLQILLIDELHEPFITSRGNTCVRICEFIREIYDELEIPIALCGTDALPNELRKGQWREALRQMLDRGNTEVCIKPRKTCKGLEDIFKYYGLPVPNKEARQLVDDILVQHSTRKLVFKIRDAVRAASKRNESVTWDHFIDAHAIAEADKAPA